MMPGLDHLIDVFAGKGDIGHLALLVWAGSATVMAAHVLRALEARLELQPDDLRYSAAMLREYGNLSSAFVYFVMKAALDDAAPGGWWWLSSFGAGFSCHGALLKVQ